MGESACVMQPFSYVSGIIDEAKEGNPLHALGESISFGRFTSESLAWERWSSFSRNRYVEEAAKYSRPGSVAQKKAFFEAHYKNIAARKAAALLEQANASAAADNKPGSEGLGSDLDSAENESQAVVSGAESADAVADNIAEENHTTSSNVPNPQLLAAAHSIVNHTAQDITNHESLAAEANAIVDKPPRENPTPARARPSDDMDKLTKVALPNGLEVSEDIQKATEPEFGEADLVKKLVLKSSNLNERLAARSNKKQEVSSKKATISRIPSSPSRISTSPAKYAAKMKENNAITLQGHCEAPMSKNKPALPSSKSQGCALTKHPPSPPKLPPAIHPGKDFSATPVTIKSTLDSWDRKRVTPKPLHNAVNKTPTRERRRFPPPAPQNSGSSRVAGPTSKVSTYCSTPLGTLTTVSSSGVAVATPQSEVKRAKTPLRTLVPGNRTTDLKWHFLSPECSNFSTASRKNLKSPVPSSPFSFRTEERAAKRKQKLEERLNAKEAQEKVQQTKFKEKAESELRKLRQSLCFKARPLPNFYKERRLTKNQTMEGAEVLHSQSPNLGRKTNPSILERTKCLPPRKPSGRRSSKHVTEDNAQAQTCFSPSLNKKVMHENTSPNIQQQYGGSELCTRR